MTNKSEIYDKLHYYMDAEDKFFVIRGNASDQLVRDFMVKTVEYTKETAIDPGLYLQVLGTRPKLADIKGFSFQLNKDFPDGRDFMVHLFYKDYAIKNICMYHSKIESLGM